MLENPKLLAKLKADGKPSVEVPEEFKSKCVSTCTYVSLVRSPLIHRVSS